MVEENVKKLNTLNGATVVDVKTKGNEAYVFFSNGLEIFIDDNIAQEPYWCLQVTPKLSDIEESTSNSQQDKIQMVVDAVEPSVHHSNSSAFPRNKSADLSSKHKSTQGDQDEN